MPDTSSFKQLHSFDVHFVAFCDSCGKSLEFRMETSVSEYAIRVSPCSCREEVDNG